jgi:hypothetical protein
MNELLNVNIGIKNDEITMDKTIDLSFIKYIHSGVKDMYIRNIVIPKIIYAYLPARNISYDSFLLSEMNFDIDCGNPNCMKTIPIALMFNTTARLP